MDATSPQAPFTSVGAIMKSHRALRKDYEARPEDPEVLERVRTFLRETGRAGTILDDQGDRGIAQSLIDFWVTALYRHGIEEEDSQLADFDLASAPELPDGVCPYPGVRAFHKEDDLPRFFGRESLVKGLVKRLEGLEPPVLMLTGAAGCGKTSVVLAGLIPSLKAGALPGSAAWGYPEVLVPGGEPGRAVRLLTERIAGAKERQVIVIDQLDGMFALCEEESALAEFEERLVALAGEGHGLVFTMRSEARSSLAKLPRLQAMLEERFEVVPLLNSAELRIAIERPAREVGLKFEEGVVERLVEDLVYDPLGLPLLQFTLLELWERRERNRVSLAVYDGLGSGTDAHGAHGALREAAHRINGELAEAEKAALRSIFLGLTAYERGGETRGRRVAVETLAGENRGATFSAVLDRLVEARLLRKTVAGGGGVPAQEQVEMVHELLVRDWAVVREWLEDAKALFRERRKLGAAAEEWRNEGRDPGFLFRGHQLSAAENLLSQLVADPDVEDPTPHERAFVEAGVAAREVEEERLARERRRRLWSRIALVGIVILLGVAWVLKLARDRAVEAEEAAVAAKRVAQAAAKRERAAKVEAQVARDRALAHQLDPVAERAARAARETEAWIYSIRALQQDVPDSESFPRSLARLTILPTLRKPSLHLVCLSDDGSRLAAADGGEVFLWNLNTGESVPLLDPRHGDHVRALCFSKDARFLASGALDGTVRIWSLGSPERPPEVLLPGGRGVTALALDERGQFLAAGAESGLLTRWEQHDGAYQLVGTWRREEHSERSVLSVRFRGSALQVVAAYADGAVVDWDAEGPEERTVLLVPPDDGDEERRFSWLTMDHSEKRGWTAVGRGEELLIRDRASDPDGWKTVDLGSTVKGVAIVDREGRIVVGTEDGAIRWLDPAQDGRGEVKVEGEGLLTGLAAGEGWVAATSAEAPLQLWSAADSTLVARIGRTAPSDPVEGLNEAGLPDLPEGALLAAFSPGGRWLAVATGMDRISGRSKLWLWRRGPDGWEESLCEELGSVTALALSDRDGGSFLAVGLQRPGEQASDLLVCSAQQVFEDWALPDQRESAAHEFRLSLLVFREGGSELISGAPSGHLRRWQITGEGLVSAGAVKVSDLGEHWLSCVAFGDSADALVVGSSDGRLWQGNAGGWVPGGWSAPRSFQAHSGAIEIVTVVESGVGRWLATASEDGELVLRDVKDPATIAFSLRGPEGEKIVVSDVDDGPEGWIAAVADNGRAYLWRVPSGGGGGAMVRAFAEWEVYRDPLGKAAGCRFFERDGLTRLATIEEGEVRIRDLRVLQSYEEKGREGVLFGAVARAALLGAGYRRLGDAGEEELVRVGETLRPLHEDEKVARWGRGVAEPAEEFLRAIPHDPNAAEAARRFLENLEKREEGTAE